MKPVRETRRSGTETAVPHPEAHEESTAELASPACFAHEMDPSYMWARSARRSGWIRRILDRLRGGRQL